MAVRPAWCVPRMSTKSASVANASLYVVASARFQARSRCMKSAVAIGRVRRGVRGGVVAVITMRPRWCARGGSPVVARKASQITNPINPSPNTPSSSPAAVAGPAAHGDGEQDRTDGGEPTEHTGGDAGGDTGPGQTEQGDAEEQQQHGEHAVVERPERGDGAEIGIVAVRDHRERLFARQQHAEQDQDPGPAEVAGAGPAGRSPAASRRIVPPRNVARLTPLTTNVHTSRKVIPRWSAKWSSTSLAEAPLPGADEPRTRFWRMTTATNASAPNPASRLRMVVRRGASTGPVDERCDRWDGAVGRGSRRCCTWICLLMVE